MIPDFLKFSVNRRTGLKEKKKKEGYLQEPGMELVR